MRYKYLRTGHRIEVSGHRIEVSGRRVEVSKPRQIMWRQCVLLMSE